ncbi:MAG: hypothetical protein ACPH86_05470, partial [Schleiferiaceae bacterium]
MPPQELTKACFKGTCTGTAKKVMGPSLAESILGLETPLRIIRKHESALLEQIDTIRNIHPELLRPVFPTPVNSTKQAEEHKESDDESDNGPVNRDASLIARVDLKIHGHAEAGDVRALWTQEWLLNKASDSDTRRQFASLYRNNGNEDEFSSSLDSEFDQEWSHTGRPSLFGKKGAVLGAERFHLLPGDLFDGFKRYSRRGGGLQWAHDLNQVKTAHEAQLMQYYSTQAFSRTSKYPITKYLVDARKYKQDQQYQLTHIRSGTGKVEHQDSQVLLASSVDLVPMEICEPCIERDNDASIPAFEAMLETNPQNNQPCVTHRVVLLLFAMRVLCQISDNYTLLLQYLMFLVFFGCLPTHEQALQLFNYGSSLAKRERLIDWRLKEDVGKAMSGAPGSWYLTSDSSNVGGLDVQTRRIHSYNEEEERPVNKVISIRALMGKDSKSVAASDFDALQDQPGLDYDSFGGGGTDNASVATLAMLDLVDMADAKFTDQTGAQDGIISRPKKHGVERKPWGSGSVIHKHHLVMKEGRNHSFGSKKGMDDPSANQLPFKLHKLYCNDPDLYAALWYEYMDGLEGWWALTPVPENEARWLVSLEANKFMRRLMFELPNGKSFSGFCMYARDRQPSSSWTIGAYLQCAVWSESPAIQIAQLWEIEVSERAYQPALNFWRSRSSRSYMSHYLPGYLMRLMPSYIHCVFLPVIKNLLNSPPDVLPRTYDLINTQTEEKKREYIDRISCGAQSMLKLT